MAYRKKCPECGEYSYSANRKGMWRCPYCGADISDVKAEVGE
ncbi:MAG: hypothetical protein ACOCQA_01920 [bacterium]